jgi:LacI family transcriptional regulator
MTPLANKHPFHRVEDDSEPLYGQVLRWLTEVLDREFRHEQRFYTERELMEALKVSQPTVRRALAELVAQGRLYRHVGKGTFVQKFKEQRLLGVILPQHQSPVLMQQLNAFASLCDTFDCNLRVHHTRKGERIRDMARTLKADPSLERMVFLGHTHESAWTLFDELDHRGFRTVCAIPFTDSYPGDCVSIDGIAGARLALDHLLGLGHERIVILVNEPEALANIKVRLDALREEVTRRRLSGVTFHMCETPNWSDSYTAALEAMPKVLGDHGSSRPTAIMPISGIGAWAAVRYAAQHRLDVPGDFSVFSFDDIPGSSLLHPPLTALGVDHQAFATQVLNLLWSDSKTPRRETLIPRIIPRDSTSVVGAGQPGSGTCRL